MKTLRNISLVVLLTMTLSACNMPKDQSDSKTNQSANIDQQVAASLSPTPTLSKDNSLDSIESDLKSTTILEEDFSSIK